MSTIIRFRRDHGLFTTRDDYAFDAEEAQRFVAADLADEVPDGSVVTTDAAINAAVAGKASGSRARKITKG